MTHASPDHAATQAANVGTWSKTAYRACVKEQESAVEAGGEQGSPTQLRLQLHNTLVSVVKALPWVPPSTSAFLLPHARVHDSLLPAQTLSSPLCKLHHQKRSIWDHLFSGAYL